MISKIFICPKCEKPLFYQGLKFWKCGTCKILYKAEYQFISLKEVKQNKILEGTKETEND